MKVNFNQNTVAVRWYHGHGVFVLRELEARCIAKVQVQMHCTCVLYRGIVHI